MFKDTIRVATDVGGTYTDLVFIQSENGIQRIGTTKADTTPQNIETGVLDAFYKTELTPADINFFVHGSTVVINALTVREGAKTALITTTGFRDVLEIARGDRPDYFNLAYVKPKPFIPRHLSYEMSGRISATGEELEPLQLEQLPKILAKLAEEKVTAIAICFLNSYVNPKHEQDVAQEIQKLNTQMSVTASFQISREWREYERTNTTVLSAYVKPIVKDYITHLADKLKESKFPSAPYFMQSNGGITTQKGICDAPIAMVESGPASGMAAAAVLSKLLSKPYIIGLDIGGTTAKCSLISNYEVPLNTQYYIERNKVTSGYPILSSVVDIVEIGNGGGSIADIDQFGKLHVGPQSAGAVPGPIAYGKGGTQLTTTDACLALGYINPNKFCNRSVAVDMHAVNLALSGLAKRLELPTDIDAAKAIIRIANSNMISALKLVSVNRGFDPRDFTLIAFGGGGGMHACDLAMELGIKEVVIPKNSAEFSALGMLLCDIRRDAFRSQLVDLSDKKAYEIIYQIFAAMEEEIAQTFLQENFQKSQLTFKRYGSFRYQNQEHSIEIAIPEGRYDESTIALIIKNFHHNYEREYTYQLVAANVELINFHLVTFAEVEKIQLPKLPVAEPGELAKALIGQRELTFLEDRLSRTTNIYDGAYLMPGMEFKGPAIIETNRTSYVITPNMPVRIDEYGNVRITLLPLMPVIFKQVDAITLEIIQAAVQAIAEEMFATMRRTAMSSIIYEVLDMGTAITNKDGELICSGIGIPIFSNILGACIQAIQKKFTDSSIKDGDVFILNDPYEGGVTHLNDVALAMPVFFNNELIAWTAVMAHFSDLGGIAPGSISTEATSIFQEGLIIKPIKLIEENKSSQTVFDLLKANSRLPDYLLGDLNAAIAAVRRGRNRIFEMVTKYSNIIFQDAINSTLNFGEEVTRRALKKLTPTTVPISIIEEQDNGQMYQAVISLMPDSITVDLRNNPKQDSGPYNLSYEGTLVAVYMVLKSFTSPEKMSNGGNYRPFKVLTSKGTIFDAEFPAAMGVYYETLIRLHDLIWRGLANVYPDRLPAGSFSSVCGTFFGGKDPQTKREFTVIEPQVGGWGGSKMHDGNSAIFSGIHGVTFNCPAEINEAKAAILVRSIRLNNESRGEGKHAGGRGVCIEYEMLAEEGWITVAYSRVKIQPWPLLGGTAGSCNYIEIIRKTGLTQRYTAVTNLSLTRGDVIRVVTGNGAGYGDPIERPVDAVRKDLKDEYLTLDQAEKFYPQQTKQIKVEDLLENSFFSRKVILEPTNEVAKHTIQPLGKM